MGDDFTQIQKAAVAYYNAYQAWQQNYGRADFSDALGASVTVFRDFQTALGELPLTTPQGKLARCELEAAMEQYVTLTGLSRFRYLHKTPKETYTLDEHFGGDKKAGAQERDLHVIMKFTQDIIRGARELPFQQAVQKLERECATGQGAEALMELRPSIPALAMRASKVRE